ncbi:MAG TPA: cytochrome c3 family protein [Coriobacteriia bacterium]
MRRRTRILLFAIVAALWLAAPAFAYDEPHNMPEQHTGSGGVLRDCVPCHRLDETKNQCAMCHASHGVIGANAGKGPHGLYTATTDRCDACHDIHAAAGAKLLPSATVTGSCYTCHDGTGGKGVYGSIAMRGLAVGGQHRVDTTSTVPGGNAATGGSATMSFRGLNGTLGCNDCHSPHGASTVASFSPERKRVTFSYIFGFKSDKLLRRNPGGSTATATVYGSDWCLACHRGRASMGPVNNHPVESAATTTSPYYYDNVALLVGDDLTTATTNGTMASTNRGYLMPMPRTSQQRGHGPICQQCHEDSRNVGTLSPDGLSADAATFSITATDGAVSTDNPRFQNFPHETENVRMTVETGDDLCTNCHAPLALP